MAASLLLVGAGLARLGRYHAHGAGRTLAFLWMRTLLALWWAAVLFGFATYRFAWIP